MGFRWSRLGIFVGGMAAATVGYRALRSKEAKKAATVITSAVLREKDNIMKEVTEIREDCSDIYADALDRNERLAEEKIIEDAEKAEKRAAREAEEKAAEACAEA
ncbi:MAG: DUF6110 family protein [Lachnospiraceae bacterium]|nr:DUF6110 family protein [Lachnospiraceae bacterium]